MGKGKKFREWVEDDAEQNDGSRFKKKDAKRYDRGKASIKEARRAKKRAKDTFFK